MKKLLLILAAAALPLLGRAQAVLPKVYGLTNSASFSITNGAFGIAAGASSNLNSTPFPIWRDRGFVINLAYYPTNASTANVTNIVQFATPIKVGSTLVTNWGSTGTLTSVTTLNGTNEVFAQIAVPKTTADNMTYGRLQTVGNAHTATLFLDPTNSFISVIP